MDQGTVGGDWRSGFAGLDLDGRSCFGLDRCVFGKDWDEAWWQRYCLLAAELGRIGINHDECLVGHRS